MCAVQNQCLIIWQKQSITSLPHARQRCSFIIDSCVQIVTDVFRLLWPTNWKTEKCWWWPARWLCGNITSSEHTYREAHTHTHTHTRPQCPTLTPSMYPCLLLALGDICWCVHSNTDHFLPQIIQISDTHTQTRTCTHLCKSMCWHVVVCWLVTRGSRAVLQSTEPPSPRPLMPCLQQYATKWHFICSILPLRWSAKNHRPRKLSNLYSHQHAERKPNFQTLLAPVIRRQMDAENVENVF